MSVRSTKRRGRDIWHVEVRRTRGDLVFHRRRFLDRRTHRKAEALAVEAQLLAEFEAQLKGANLCNSNNHLPTSNGHPSGAAIGFRAFAEQFLELQDPTRTDFDNKRRNVMLHLVPFFGDTPLPEVSRMKIDRFRVRLRTSPIARRRGRRSPKTVNNILATLHTILALAHDYELISRVPKIKKEPVAKQDPEFLDDEEVGLLVAAVPLRWRPLVHTAVLTGLRRGELYELRWGDISLDGPRCIRVTRSVQIKSGVCRVKPPKGMRGRTVPLCAEAFAVLAAHRPANAHPNDLVFPEDDGGYMREKRFYRLVVDAGKKALGKHVRAHMLRHTFASQLYQLGVPGQNVQQWLGHAHMSTTERYAHLQPDTGSDLIERLSSAKRVSQLCEEPTNTLTNTSSVRTTKNAVQNSLDGVLKAPATGLESLHRLCESRMITVICVPTALKSFAQSVW